MEPMLPGASARGSYSDGVEVRQAIGISPRNQQQHLTAQSFGPRHPDCPRLTRETESESDQIARLFKETDTDKSGKLNMKEIKILCQKLGDTMSAKALEEAFERMDPEMTGEVRNLVGRPETEVSSAVGAQGRSEHLPGNSGGKPSWGQ